MPQIQAINTGQHITQKRRPRNSTFLSGASAANNIGNNSKMTRVSEGKLSHTNAEIITRARVMSLYNEMLSTAV